VSGARPPLPVALLRGIPEHVGSSVRQFADALEQGFRTGRDVELIPIELPELGLARRLSRGRQPPWPVAGAENVLDAFLRYPLSIRRATRGRPMPVYHVIDQWYGHLAAWLPPNRTIVSCQDLILAKYPELDTDHRPTRRDRWRFAASTGLLHRVAHVVCSTQAVKADLMRLKGVAPDRISVVPKGIAAGMRPLPETSATPLGARAPAAAGALVLHVSSGWPYKNVEATIRVIAALRERGVEAKLVRVGVPLTERERRLAERLRVMPWIGDYGWVDEQRLTELYNAADVLLFPSLDEGFGRPPLEAMACGTPVVTSTAPALVEATGDAALHAAANDVAGLARAVEAVLSRPSLAADLRARGLRRASRFTWPATVDAYAEIYERVAR
jgi:glycosyltransferase involved in cell wall biosynthesis